MNRKWRNRLAFIIGSMSSGLIFSFLDPEFLNTGILAGGIFAVFVAEGIL